MPEESEDTSTFVRTVDAISERTGRLVSWLLLLLVSIGALNAIVRYAGRFFGVDLSSNAYLELQWYLFGAVFLLGGGFTLKHRAHVRVDIVYDRVSPPTRLTIDRLGVWLLLLPFCAVVLWVSFAPVLESFERMEQSPDPGGLPRYLVKPLIPIGFALLLLQGIAEAIRRRPTSTSPDEEARL